MEATFSSLETEILTKALEKPLFSGTYPQDKTDTFLRLLLSMKAQLTSQLSSSSKDPKQLAILLRRFAINSQSLITAVPVSQKTNYQSKLYFLQTQVTDAECEYKKLMAKLQQTQGVTSTVQNGYSYPSVTGGGGSGQQTMPTSVMGNGGTSSSVMAYPAFNGSVGGVGASIALQSNPMSYPGINNQSQMINANTSFQSQSQGPSGYPSFGTQPSSQTYQKQPTGYQQPSTYPGFNQFQTSYQQSYNYPQQTYHQQPPAIQYNPQLPQTTKPVVSTKPPTNLRQMICPLEIVEEFIKRAQANTSKKVETCAILAGIEINDKLIINTLIIPQQEGQHDHCYMTEEFELFEKQIELKVMTLGWIHTHPQYSLFLSSVDLHNQLGYQLQMPEAVAIVYSPIEASRYKAFRVQDTRMTEIQGCQQKGFHEHKDTSGRYAWEECAHLQYVQGATSGIKCQVVELRKSC